jgi:hypothetical protein
MNKIDIFDLYTDYLIASFGSTTATGLSELVKGEVSHDQVTRFLSQRDFTSKDLWKETKKFVREIETEEGLLIIDDTIQEKQYSKENDLICWHYDHCEKRTVKGINLLNCLYYSKGVSLPVAFELIKKSVHFCDVKTRVEKRVSEITKNEQLRQILTTCSKNNLQWTYVLADIWFSSSENMMYIHKDLEKKFIFPLKSNRLIALNKADKINGCYMRIDSIQWSEEPIQGWVKGVNFPVLLHCQNFKNKDGSIGFIYLISNDLNATKTILEKTYQKRWKVEVFHKSIKSNTGMAKSPARTVRTQSNHIFMSIYATVRLEMLSIQQKTNKFALKSKLYLNAMQQAFKQLQTIKLVSA